MFFLDIAALAWSDITDLVTGAVPSHRDSFGFIAADNKLYAMGGQDAGGESSNIYSTNFVWFEIHQQGRGQLMNLNSSAVL